MNLLFIHFGRICVRTLPWLLTAFIASTLMIGARLPAAWFMPALAHATHDRVHLTAPSGSLWRGSAILMLSSGADTLAPTVLPGRIEWRTAFWPLFTGRLQLIVHAVETMPAPVEFSLTRRTATLSPGQLTIPAGMLAGLGAPFNTLDLKGEVQLEWNRWHIFDHRNFGQLIMHLNQMHSRVTRIAPLGTYRVRIQAKGREATLALSTTRGPLLLEGRGGWRAQRFFFQGTASAHTQARENLRPLLTLLGPRLDDTRYALNFTR